MRHFGHHPGLAFFGRRPGLAFFARRRSVGLGLLSTGVVCPCHVLVGLVGLLGGGSLLTPAAQDGLHAVYVPLVVLAGALLLRRRAD